MFSMEFSFLFGMMFLQYERQLVSERSKRLAELINDYRPVPIFKKTFQQAIQLFVRLFNMAAEFGAHCGQNPVGKIGLAA